MPVSLISEDTWRHHLAPFMADADVRALSSATSSQWQWWRWAAHRWSRWVFPTRAASRALDRIRYRTERGRCLYPGCQGMVMIYIHLTEEMRTTSTMPVCVKHLRADPQM